MTRKTDKDLTREELLVKLALTRRKLRRTSEELRMRQDEIMDMRREEFARLHPPTPPENRPLHATFDDLPNGNLAMRFSRPIQWITIDEPSANVFLTQINRWLQLVHARRPAPAPKPTHLRLVKETDRDI